MPMSYCVRTVGSTLSTTLVFLAQILAPDEAAWETQFLNLQSSVSTLHSKHGETVAALEALQMQHGVLLSQVASCAGGNGR
jgi:hypothetical protein